MLSCEYVRECSPHRRDQPINTEKDVQVSAGERLHHHRSRSAHVPAHTASDGRRVSRGHAAARQLARSSPRSNGVSMKFKKITNKLNNFVVQKLKKIKVTVALFIFLETKIYTHHRRIRF